MKESEALEGGATLLFQGLENLCQDQDAQKITWNFAGCGRLELRRIWTDMVFFLGDY